MSQNDFFHIFFLMSLSSRLRSPEDPEALLCPISSPSELLMLELNLELSFILYIAVVTHWLKSTLKKFMTTKPTLKKILFNILKTDKPTMSKYLIG